MPGIFFFRPNLYTFRLIFYLKYFLDLLLHFQPQKKVDLRIPIHFMDMPGIVPISSIPLDLSFCCNFQGWVYLALIGQKVSAIIFKNVSVFVACKYFLEIQWQQTIHIYVR